MTELLATSEIDRVRAQFKEYGHVGVAGVYAPTQGIPAARQLLKVIPGRPRTRNVLGEQLGNTPNFRPQSGRQELSDVIRNIHGQVDLLGDRIWPQDITYFLQYIDMLPGTKGPRHVDRPGFIGAVAITTLEGSSRLLVEGGADYPIEPGNVVFLNPDRNLEHQGIAGPEAARTGLVVAVR